MVLPKTRWKYHSLSLKENRLSSKENTYGRICNPFSSSRNLSKKKHPEDIQDYNQFIEGVIFPDSVSDKSMTHYGEKSSKVHLNYFLAERELEEDFDKGYFLHLVTDYIFYNKFLDYFSRDIYQDYDILNQELQEKFHVKIPDRIKDKVFYQEGTTKILKLNEVVDFIEEVSSYRLRDIEESIAKQDTYWLELRPLRRLESEDISR